METKRIKEFAKIRRGASPRPIDDPKYFGGEVGWVRISDVTASRKFLKTTTQYVSKLGESLSVRVDKGDLVMSIAGTVGRPIIIDMPACIHDGFVQIYDFEKNSDREFLYYYLKHLEKELGRYGQSGTQTNLNTEIVGNIQLNCFDKEEEKLIATIIALSDSVIEETESLIMKYQRIKTGLMQDLLTLGIDEKGNIRSKASHKFVIKKGIEVPQEWEVDFLHNSSRILVSNVDKKSHDSESKVLLCNYMDVYSNREISKNLSFMEATATQDEIQKFKLQENDVIITKDSETPDDIAVPSVVIDNLDNLICGYHLALIRPNKKLNGYFLMYQFLQHKAKIHFGSLATGSTRYGLKLSTIEKYLIVIPKIEEQKKIVERIYSLDKLIEDEKKSLNKFNFIKTGLMQDLLSGKVRV